RRTSPWQLGAGPSVLPTAVMRLADGSGPSAHRQRAGEAAAGIGVVADAAAMPARDLLHQRKTEPRALRAGAARNTIEPREQLFARARLDHRSLIGHLQQRLAVALADRRLDRRLAVQLRILDQVADQPAQQHRVTTHRHRLAADRAVVVARAFL